MHSYELIHSNRKTLSIEIHADGTLLVRAPLRLSRKRIDAAVAAKEAWIERKLAQARQLQIAGLAGHTFQKGDSFYFLGSPYPLMVVDLLPTALVFKDAFYLQRSSLPQASALITAWYQQQAVLLLPERLKNLAELHGFTPGQVKINSARTRWGSCSTTGAINLSWRLLIAPPETIDYVLIHEMVHLKIKNHSKNFWLAVQRFDPNYIQHRRWLKEHAQLALL